MTISVPLAESQAQVSDLFPTDGGDQGFGQLELMLLQLIGQLLTKYLSSYGGGSWSGGGTWQPYPQGSSTVPTISSNDAAQAVASDLEQRYGLTPTQAAGVLG
ncbi:MAG: hypothetical protein KGQ57_13665, partial [Burkholderiales bacterium]|nr:hypothetical protein [Burkholderiales bacterium]